jgi:hypothetical protein
LDNARKKSAAAFYAAGMPPDLNQNAVDIDGIRGRCGFLNYLRRDATALGLMLLSMSDITSSFQ